MGDNEVKQILLSLPVEIHREAERRATAGKMSIQHLITLTLAVAWEVDPPPLRSKGRPKKDAG